MSLRSGVLPLSLPSQVGLAFFIGAFSIASAQTAPQLLPYTVKVIAGGGTKAVAAGGTCPVSGFTATDAYGDGCLATEVLLGTSATAPGARAAIADSQGNVFFGDYVNGVVHRVDAATGILSAVAGGAASSPASGATCGANTSTDAKGDGCLSTLVHLSHPTGLAFAPNGDLYFGDYGYGEIRKVASTSGFVPATGGIISLVAGSAAGTSGYTISNQTTTINAATQSVLDGPYGLAFDTQGDLFLTDEYTASALVINTNATGTNTVNSVPVAAGTIWKIAGTVTSGGPYCVNGTGSSSGCTYNHTYTDGLAANSDYLRNAYGIAVDPSGNVYITDEYYDTIQKVSPSGILTTFAGMNNTSGSTQTRGPAGTIAIGSPFGVASDTLGNVYFPDAADGVIWRVDAANHSQYVIATGFGSTNSGGFASSTLPGPGIYSLSADANSNLYYGDTEKNIVGEVASGTQFGPVGENQSTTQTLKVHFAANDAPPAASGYSFSSGASIFTLGTAACSAMNSDGTTDCLLPLTATPTTLGAFSGKLNITSSLGVTGTFQLSGISVMTPVTRISVAVSSTGTTCAGTAVYPTTASLTLTATIVSSGSPTGTVTFFANGVQIGTPQTVNKSVATLSYTFTTPNTYSITATYSGDSYYNPSTSPSTVSIATSAPSFSASAIASQQSTVAAGQTGLYSFNLAQNVYTGTITLACSGLPSNASCSFSPAAISANGCSTTSVVALSILTQQGAVNSSGAGLGLAGRGLLSMLSLVSGFGLALLIGIRRRRAPLRFGQLWMVLALLIGISAISACGNATLGGPATPSGNYTVTVTATGSTGTTATFTVPLTVK
jgi:hypothetical protein